MCCTVFRLLPKQCSVWRGVEKVLWVPCVCSTIPARGASCGFAGCQSGVDLVPLSNMPAPSGSSGHAAPAPPSLAAQPSSCPKTDVPVCGPEPEQAAGACCGDPLLSAVAGRCGQEARTEAFSLVKPFSGISFLHMSQKLTKSNSGLGESVRRGSSGTWWGRAGGVGNTSL